MSKIILISAKAQHGKDTTANILKEQLESRNKTVLIAHFGDLLKYICKTFFNWNGEKDDVGRSILQRVGTDIIRNQIPSYWLDFIKNLLIMFPDEWDYVLIPDCRFKNEVDWGVGWNTTSLRIKRLNFISPLTKEQLNHISETDLDDYEFDFYIETESGIENVRKAVLNIIEDII